MVVARVEEEAGPTGNPEAEWEAPLVMVEVEATAMAVRVEAVKVPVRIPW